MRTFLFFSLLSTLLPQFVLGALPDWSPPLSTRGRYVVDSKGNRFKLNSGNWHGASGTYSGSGDINDDANHHSGQNAHGLPLGLEYAPIADMLDKFESYGINSIRLPFSNEMLHDSSTVRDDWVRANPQLRGKTPLQVYDAVIEALTARGFAVILNNHTNKSRWCCGVADGNERWDSSQSLDEWVSDWVMLVKRYKNNKRVVGADLYNEVRRDILTDPEWGTGSSPDWQRASQIAGDRILADANPDILIIVEGINWVGLPVDGFFHERPTLKPVANVSHTLKVSNKLVYSAHFYGYTGPNHSGATGIGETTDPRYRDLSKNDLFEVMRNTAAYVALDKDAHYTAPLWISEFGVSSANPGQLDRNWFTNTLEYMSTNDIDFAYWPLMGYLDNGQGNGWSLLKWDTSRNHLVGLLDGGDWRENPWKSFISNSNTKTGYVDPVTNWKMLNIAHGDFVQSLVQQGRDDWDNGARKAMCPDGLRIIGISNSNRRALCTDATFGNLWHSDRSTSVVWTEEHVDTDWAGGYTKYQCPANHFLLGYGVRGSKVSTIICGKASRSLGKSSSTTVWFDQGDNRRHQGGKDWAKNDYKGQCGADEYVAGIAFTTRIFKSGLPDAILCRK